MRTQSATTDKMEESSLPHTDKMAVSEDIESPNADKFDTEPMNEDQEGLLGDKEPVVEASTSEPMNEDQEEDSGGDEKDNESDGANISCLESSIPCNIDDAVI